MIWNTKKEEERRVSSLLVNVEKHGMRTTELLNISGAQKEGTYPSSGMVPLSLNHERKTLLLIMTQSRIESSTSRRLHLNGVNSSDLLQKSANRKVGRSTSVGGG